MDIQNLQESLWTAQEFQLRRFEDYISAGLAQLLDMKFTPPFSCATEEYIANIFRCANKAIDDGNTDEARFLILIPTKLLQCLTTIQEYDDDLLREFRNDFHEVEFDRYYGVRCEVETARSLLLHGFKFEHPDPPDFRFDYKAKSLEIECTSIHVESSTEYRQKICDVIHDKAGKYSGGSTGLFIDVTNILHHSFEEGDAVTREHLKDWITEDTEIFNWETGSILLWSYVYERNTEKFHHAYIRSDTPNIATDLENFLDENYPIDKFEGDAFRFPSQG